MKKVLMIILALMLSVSVLAACTTEQPQEEPTPEEKEQALEDALEQADQAEALVEDAEKQKEEVIKDVSGEMDLAGTWQDEVSQRASMDVTKNDDGSYDIQVTWGGGATETAIWKIHGTYDPASGMLSYQSGSYTVHTWDEDGTETVSDPETTEGAFMKEGDKLRWQDSKNSEAGLFVKFSD